MLGIFVTWVPGIPGSGAQPYPPQLLCSMILDCFDCREKSSFMNIEKSLVGSKATDPYRQVKLLICKVIIEMKGQGVRGFDLLIPFAQE